MPERLAAARRLLARHRVIHLSTVGPDGPACAPLFYALVGEGLDLCWVSSPSAAHSRHLDSDDRVAGSVSAGRPPARRIHGLQLRGRALLASDQQVMRERYLRHFPWAETVLLSRGDHRFYVLHPSWFRLIRTDEGSIRRDEVQLP